MLTKAKKKIINSIYTIFQRETVIIWKSFLTRTGFFALTLNFKKEREIYGLVRIYIAQKHKWFIVVASERVTNENTNTDIR